MVELYAGGIPVQKVLGKWLDEVRQEGKFGAFIPFIGIVRAEKGIEGLSFDIYPPLLEKWFKKWEKLSEGKIFMAHSIGDVKIGETSFLAVVATSHRQEGFALLKEFVENFKKEAPIWKYDLIEGKRYFLMERASPLQNAGLLSRER